MGCPCYPGHLDGCPGVGGELRCTGDQLAALSTTTHASLEDFVMGMYDQEPNFEQKFNPGDRMILVGMQYVGPVNTKHGPAEKVFITVVTRDNASTDGDRVTGKPITYSALGVGFAALAKRASRADFPHVAE